MLLRRTAHAPRADGAPEGQTLRGAPGCSTALRPGGGSGAAAVPRGAGASGSSERGGSAKRVELRRVPQIKQ